MQTSAGTIRTSQEAMQLVLIRHGESEWNRLNLFTGWTDVELSETGRAEAAEGGRALAREGFDFDICYTSRLKRAIHTLDIVLTELDRSGSPSLKHGSSMNAIMARCRGSIRRRRRQNTAMNR